MKRLIVIVLLMLTCVSAFAEEKASEVPSAAPVTSEPAPAPPAAPKIDTGDTAWLIVSSAFVMFMSLPGLAIFYGGIAKRKDILNTLAMTFSAYAIVSVLWVIYGYTFTFNGNIAGLIGTGDKVLLAGVTVNSIIDAAKTIPEIVFVMFQCTFASITVALVSGSFIERMKFSAWILFVVLWFTLSYVPIAHWVWGGGILATMGALDFAGGTVVHINAGIAALVGCIILGKRKDAMLLPNNLPLVIIGAGMLWFGWFGFNGGSALAANGLAGMAFINTNIAAALGALSWMFAEWLYSKKPTLLGLASGAVAGLVVITPAAGFVNTNGAIIMGIFAGIIPFFAVAVVKHKLGYDDTLDVFGIHGVGGMVGAVLTGVFADPAINEAGKGLLYGNPGLLLTQIIAVAITIIYVAIITAVVFMIIKAIVGLRVDVEDEITGLDESQHGEKAYN
jgi:Amt family ammonium transporter